MLSATLTATRTPNGGIVEGKKIPFFWANYQANELADVSCRLTQTAYGGEISSQVNSEREMYFLYAIIASLVSFLILKWMKKRRYCTDLKRLDGKTVLITGKWDVQGKMSSVSIHTSVWHAKRHFLLPVIKRWWWYIFFVMHLFGINLKLLHDKSRTSKEKKQNIQQIRKVLLHLKILECCHSSVSLQKVNI